MATKHTPGPWHYEHIGQDGWGISSNNLEGIAIVPHSLNMTHDEANARLIAAAPDLLQALDECITEQGAYCYQRLSTQSLKKRLASINNTARTAIAKATQKEGRMNHGHYYSCSDED